MKRMIPVLMLVLGVASTPTAGAADAIKGCYKKSNGQFRVLVGSKSCLPSEKAVSLSTDTTAGGVSGHSSPLVYDANDQFLGVGQGDEIYIPSLRLWAPVNLRDNPGDIWSGLLYYTSADCTGQAYVEYEYLHWIFGFGDTQARKYYTAAPELEGTLRIGSYTDCWANSTTDCTGDCVVQVGDERLNVSKAVEVTLPFTVPIALPTKIVNP